MSKDKKGEKVVLAYSGGLDTSVILPWLKETYGYQVVAFAAELGQGDELATYKEKGDEIRRGQMHRQGSAQGICRRLSLADAQIRRGL